jgi:hypothetical protein
MDLLDRGFGQGGCGFLKPTRPLARNFIANPPYERAQALTENLLT